MFSQLCTREVDCCKAAPPRAFTRGHDRVHFDSNLPLKTPLFFGGHASHRQPIQVFTNKIVRFEISSQLGGCHLRSTAPHPIIDTAMISISAAHNTIPVFFLSVKVVISSIRRHSVVVAPLFSGARRLYAHHFYTHRSR